MRELAWEAGYLSAIAAGGPFGGSVGTDPSDPTRPVVQLTQGGTLLPDRDYYLKDDAKPVEIRAQYEEYLATLFRLTDFADALPRARAVLALETELARAQWSQVDSRDPRKTSNRYTLTQLGTAMPGFDWLAWAKPQGIDRAPYVVLSQPSFFIGFAALMGTTPLDTWTSWLAARYVTACAPFLSNAFAEARFDFFGRVLSGQQQPRTRWKRGVSLVSGYLGDAVGRLYVERRFSPKAKTRAQGLVANLLLAYRQAIKGLDWMGSKTRAEALDKRSRLEARVGYPEQWRDYGGLVIRADDLLGNVERAKKFENDARMARLVQPASRDEWLITPQTVNASYNPATNEIVLPAAILPPPLFDADADDAVNYGGIGAVNRPRDRPWLRRARTALRRKGRAARLVEPSGRAGVPEARPRASRAVQLDEPARRHAREPGS